MWKALSFSLAMDILKWQTNTRDCMEFDYFPEKAFDAFQLKIANAHAQPATLGMPNRNRYAVWWAAKIAFYAPKCEILSIPRLHTYWFCVHCAAHHQLLIANVQGCSRDRTPHFAFIIILSNKTEQNERNKVYTHRQISREPGPCKNVYYSFLIWYLFIFLRAVTGWGYMDDAGPHFNFSN